MFERKNDYDRCVALLDEQEVVDFLAELIRTDSSNPPGNEADVARKVRDKLAQYGITASIEALDQANRANLTARIGDVARGPNLVFSGHYDVVPSGNGWTHPPFGAEISDGVMYGRGASDMKGGDVAMTLAMCVLKKAGVALKGALTLFGTSGEEVDLYGSRSYVARHGVEGIDAIAVSEASNGKIFVAEKGTLWIKFTSRGKRAHAGQPAEGVNALTNMLRFVDLLNDFTFETTESTYLTPPTMVLSSMHAGDLTNVIPDTCEATFDIRTVPGNDHSKIIKIINQKLDFLKNEDSSIDITMEIQHNLIPIETDVKNTLVKKAVSSFECVFDKSPDISGVVYYTDAVPFREKKSNIPVIIYGPGNFTRNHKIEEYVEIDQVIDATKFYIALALSYLN